MFKTIAFDVEERDMQVTKKIKRRDNNMQKQKQLQQELQQTSKIVDLEQLKKLNVQQIKNQIRLYQQEGMTRSPNRTMLVFSENRRAKRKEELVNILTDIVLNKTK